MKLLCPNEFYIMIQNYPSKEQIEHKNSVEMLKNDIFIEISNHKDELDKLIPDKLELIYKPIIDKILDAKQKNSKYNIDCWYRNTINFVILRTAFHSIYIQISIDVNKKIHYTLQVKPTYNCWKKLERLSTEEISTTFEWERLKKLIIYAKKVQHIILSREEQVQKIMAVAVKEGQLLKDFI